MAKGPAFPKMPGSAGPGTELLQRAMFALNSHRPNEAELIAGKILQVDPRHPQALNILGSALLMQDRVNDAIALLEPAARGGQYPEIDTQLAIALRRAGRHDDALARLKRATRRQPPYAAAFSELGSLLAAMERYDEAIETLRRGLEAAPLMSDLSIQLGYIFLARRDCFNAKTSFARALDISSGSFEALYGMAKAHQEIGESQAAVDYFRRCLTIRPNDANAWLNLGQCQLELGQRDAGYACFRAAARGDAKRYGIALSSLAASSRGRFWLKPSAAAQYFRDRRS
jgi:tetratricopeptide (TPR) repeat protein